MMRPLLTELRTLLGGMVKDIIAALIPKNQYTEAQNMKLSEPTENTLGGMSVSVGNEQAFSLGVFAFDNGANKDYKGYRIAIDNTAPGIVHSFSFNGAPAIPFSSANGVAALRYAELVSLLIAKALLDGLTLTVYVVSPLAGTAALIHLGVRCYGSDWTLREDFVGGQVTTPVIKEYYGPACNGPFQPINTLNIKEDLYVVSTNGFVFRLGVAKKNEATGNWTYAVVLETKTFVISTDSLIDLDGEIDFETRVSLYLSGSEVLPRALYVRLQNVWATQSAFIWDENPAHIEAGNTIGYYTHENVEGDTALQILKNFAKIALTSVNASGGKLTTGENYYTIRQLVDNQISTGFSNLSAPVAVYQASQTSVRLYGNTGGLPTTKSVTLSISGLNPDLYGKFEIVFVQNINGVLTPNLIGSYKIMSETMSFTHTGSESYVSISLTELVTEQIVIRSAKNLVINRNRLFLSNVIVQNDIDLSAFTAAITVNTSRATIPAIGPLFTAVGEYQKPENIFNKTGYMLNETYRLGIQFVFKKTGFVSAPYFIKDWTCTYATGELTTGGTTPTNIYSYYPECVVDFTGWPTIDGVPFAEAIYGFSIVRRPCVPEVLITGYVMPATTVGASSYNTGRNAALLLTMTALTADAKRTQLGFLSPDVDFGLTDIPTVTAPDTGIILRVYGQPELYNHTGLNNVGVTAYFGIVEWNGNFSAAYQDYTTLDCVQVIDFNSTSDIPVGPKTYNTLVVASVDEGGNDQRSIGMHVDPAGSHVVKNTAATDYGFYYAQYIKPLTGKYGPSNTGTYISTGHSKVATGTTSYTEAVFGGDTFTQKSFLKFCNRDQNDNDVTTLVLQNVPAAAPAFSVGTYTYYMYAILPGGTRVGRQAAVVRGGGDINKSVTVSMPVQPFLPATYEVIRDTPGAPGTYTRIYSGATNSFIDDNSVVGPVVGAPAGALIYRTAISVYTQNRFNLQMRYFDVADASNYPYTTTSLETWLGNDELDPGVMLYSQSYTPDGTLQQKTVFNPDLPTNDVYQDFVYYSLAKITGSPQDPYRVFLPLNYKAFPAIYGGINNTFADDNILIILMDAAVLSQQLDQQEQITTTLGTALSIGDGSVLSAREQIISNFGAPIKTAALQYLTPTGRWYTAWFSPYYKKLLRRGVDGIKDLSDTNHFQSFFNQNSTLIRDEYSMVMGWDQYSNELLLSTMNAPDTATPYDSGLTYATDDIVSTGVDDQVKNYFKAKRAVPINKSPDQPANQLQYWEPYRNSNYTLSFNEKVNQWSSFYSYRSTFFMAYKNNFLTWFHTIQGDAEISDVYEHNRGSALGWYLSSFDASVTIVFNNTPEIYKTARNFWIRSETKPTYMHVRGKIMNPAGGSLDVMTYGTEADFGQKREYWWANVKNDAAITVSNPSGLNDILTARISGETTIVTIYYGAAATINEVSQTYYNKPRPFNL